MSAESNWLRQNWETVVTGYDKEWIAADATRVVDHDTNLTKLLDRTAMRSDELLFAYVWLGGMT